MENKIIQEVRQWSDKIGISQLKTHNLPSNILTIDIEQLKNMDAEQIEGLLLQLSAYNIFLRSEKGRALANLTFLDDKHKRQLYLATQRLENSKFKSKEEREALALMLDGELARLHDQVVTARVKYNKLYDIPAGLDNLMNNIKIYYNRRFNARTNRDSG